MAKMISWARPHIRRLSPSTSSRMTVIQYNTRLRELIKTGYLGDARSLFDSMPRRDEISWTTLISGYVGAMDISEAFALFSVMRVQPALRVDHFVLSLLLKACTLVMNPNLGESVHGYAIKTGEANSLYVGSALLDMYTKAGRIELGYRIFDEMPLKNVISWTALINGLISCGHCREAVSCFAEMCKSEVQCNGHTFAIILKACADLDALSCGREIHTQIIKKGFDASSFVANSLATMYNKCRKFDNAVHLLERMATQDVVSWTTIITTYIQMGMEESAFEAFLRMKRSDATPDEYTYGAVISACASLSRTKCGEQLHAQVLCKGLSNSLPVANSIISMYSKLGQLSSALTIFHEITKRDIVSWNTIVTGYSQEGCGEEAFELLSWIRIEGLTPTESTLAVVLTVCSNMAILKQGMQLHALVLSLGLEQAPTIQSALINMYAKCGSIKEAYKIFDAATKYDIVVWTTMINGYAEHGYSHEAIDLFEKLASVGLRPDPVTYIGILTACSHAGLIDLGFNYFDSMSREQRINPSREHYGCMIDLLCRAGRLDEAEHMIKRMPYEHNDVVWSTLLRACNINGDVDRGRRIAEHILELDPNCAGTHIALATVYSAKERWTDAEEMRKMMKSKGVTKEPGWSWIMVKDCVSTFAAGDQSHSHSEELYGVLNFLCSQETSVQDVVSLVYDIED
ncbi:putative pentatricopeptide repeat-containing protein At3g47840 [Rhodamnia argentea]|uniref:Pentatricopeptide repeat-containing protein At3g47840 n=1 Tax=Rhodamnia argentea TaxID=178133 RepID=A0ABM3HZN7_9MYRT|nr:putative pentatricopeptide repeat-containing protein At3g47840 [Rhodamnia argentea]